MQVVIHYSRPGKNTMQYVEKLLGENKQRIKTQNILSPEFSRHWCEETWWLHGYIQPGVLIGGVIKYLFYRQWFCIMQLNGIGCEHLGYYIDIITPFRKLRGEYYITDLFLDLWVTPGGEFIEVDRDEFELAFQSGVLTAGHYKKANQIVSKIKELLSRRVFFRYFID